jgi:hypothetical protein
MEIEGSPLSAAFSIQRRLVVFMQSLRGVTQRMRKRRTAMEALMAAAAATEIFLASLGLAAMFAALALRGAFWMMRGSVRQMRFARAASAESVIAESGRAGLVPVRVHRVARAH